MTNQYSLEASDPIFSRKKVNRKKHSKKIKAQKKSIKGTNKKKNMGYSRNWGKKKC